MVYALGLDPNTSHTGWCVIKGDEYTSGVIKRHRYDLESGFEAWEIMALCVMQWMEFGRYDFVAIEDVCHDQNAHTTIVLSKLVGAIGANIRLKHIPCYYLPTATIDRSLAILGDRKRGTKALGELILGKGKTQHEYDAWAVLHTGMGVHKTKTWEKAGKT